MDIWKVKMTNNNTKIAQGLGKTPREALTDLERSLEERRDGYRRRKK